MIPSEKLPEACKELADMILSTHTILGTMQPHFTRAHCVRVARQLLTRRYMKPETHHWVVEMTKYIEDKYGSGKKS